MFRWLLDHCWRMTSFSLSLNSIHCKSYTYLPTPKFSFIVLISPSPIRLLLILVNAKTSPCTEGSLLSKARMSLLCWNSLATSEWIGWARWRICCKTDSEYSKCCIHTHSKDKWSCTRLSFLSYLQEIEDLFFNIYSRLRCLGSNLEKKDLELFVSICYRQHVGFSQHLNI